MKILAGKEKEYADWKAKNEDDPYGLEIFRYAEAWADMMEEKLGGTISLRRSRMRVTRPTRKTGLSSIRRF
jgi:hypothetical protein